MSDEEYKPKPEKHAEVAETGSDPTLAVESKEYKDRKLGLVIYGLVQIMIGGVCALFVPLMIFAMVAGGAMGEAMGQQAASPRMMVPGLIVYGVAAVWFIWLGVGTILARRWARALNLVTSWIALICGLGGMAFWVIFSPQIYEQMGETGEVPAQVIGVMRHITTVFLALIYIIGPGAFILFFRSRHVKATCEARDSKIRWTDQCPLPVLAMVFIFASWGLSGIFMGSYNFAIPFFGTIVSGGVGALVCVALVVVSFWTALGAYRLKPVAWWTGFGLSILFCISSALTFSRIDLMEFYEKMDFPEDQLELMRQMDISTQMMVVPMVVSIGAFVAYLFTIKRYFRSEPSVSS